MTHCFCRRKKSDDDSADGSVALNATTSYLTVDEIVRRKKEQARKTLVEKESAEDAYTQFNVAVYGEVKNCNDTLKRSVFSEAIQNFLKQQNYLRKRLGCSKRPPSKSAKEAYADVLLSRTTFAKSALENLQLLQGRLQEDPSLGQRVSDVLLALAQKIVTELKLEGREASLQDRLKFFPQLVLRSTDRKTAPRRSQMATSGFCKLSEEANEIGDFSPEATFRVFIAMHTACTAFEACGKEWLSRGLDDARAIFGELACIINEDVGASYCRDTVDRGVEALHLFFASSDAWHTGKMAMLEKDAREAFCTSTLEYLAAWADVQKRPESEQFLGQVPSEHATCNALAARMSADQKTYMAVESNRWSTQRNVCPEVFHDLVPLLREHCEMTLLSLRSCECHPLLPNFAGVASLFVDRTLEQYACITRVDGDLLYCEYEQKPCLLQRFQLAHRQQYKSLFLELAMQQTLDRFMVPEVSAVFVDNGVCFLHAEHGGESWLSYINKEEFARVGSNAIVMANQMCRIVYGMHSAGVRHGDLRPEAWLVNMHGVPKVHGFACAQFAPHGCMPDDISALGRCLTHLRDRCKEALRVAQLLPSFSSFVDEVASQRVSAEEAFARSTQIGALSYEYALISEERAHVEDLQRQLDAARADLNAAARKAEVNMGQVKDRVETVKQEEMVLREKHKRLVCDHTALRGEAHEDTLAPPMYWDHKSADLGRVHIVPISQRSKQFQVFRHLLVTDDPKSLNKGRDVVEAGSYSFLDLCGAWRVENVSLWQLYAAERHNVRSTMKERRMKCPPLQQREYLQRAQSCLPGYDSLHKDINEVYLLHGTGAENLMTILSNGINERFTSVALFGKGSYFAEDPAKTDQYVRGDTKLGSVPELHKRLFTENGTHRFPEYPLRAYYLLFCRQVMGYPVRVKLVNARKRLVENIDNPGGPVFSTHDQRELAPIPGMDNPPIYHHSLVAEKGGEIARFREFVQFRSARIYPEYLICYTRR